ncbi:MAG TPA: serine protease, partial [Gemmatimonadales bacterium]|nr:serine protease [Gemmatimonadales bacterium]
PERAEWLQRGEAALARGDTVQALRAFERAAAMQHAADCEMGLVRTYVQAGAYRRALAFAAHTAGAHRDVPAGGVLYAWLLHVGGQTAFAQRVLDSIEARAPGNALAAQARVQLRSPAPVASGALLSAPGRVAPIDAGPPLPAAATVTGTGVLIDEGRRTLAPLPSLGEARALWLRDGRGRRTAARIERRDEALGLALLRLEEPIEGAPGLALAPRDPFAGSPGFGVDYTATPDAAPAWPLLRPGFIGSPDGATGSLKLGIELPAGAQGGPVLDAGGRFVGITARGPDGRPRLLPLSTLRRAFGDLLGVLTGPDRASTAPVDGLYEIAMPITLQVIAEP